MTKLIGSASLTATDAGTDLTTKGDIHGYGSSNTRIPVGSNDTVLTAASGEALGVKWAAAAGGVSTNTVTGAITAERTTTSTSFEDITDLEIELSDESGGIATIITNCSLNSSADTTNMHIAIGDDGGAVGQTAIETQRGGGHHTSATTSWSMETNGSSITTMGKTESGQTMTFQYSANSVMSQIMASEVY